MLGNLKSFLPGVTQPVFKYGAGAYPPFMVDLFICGCSEWQGMVVQPGILGAC